MTTRWATWSPSPPCWSLWRLRSPLWGRCIWWPWEPLKCMLEWWWWQPYQGGLCIWVLGWRLRWQSHRCGWSNILVTVTTVLPSCLHSPTAFKYPPHFPRSPSMTTTLTLAPWPWPWLVPQPGSTCCVWTWKVKGIWMQSCYLQWLILILREYI